LILPSPSAGTIIELIGTVTRIGIPADVKVEIYIEMYSNHREKAISGTLLLFRRK
jgi:hypothetical protein